MKADLTFNLVLVLTGFIAVFACMRRRQQLQVAIDEMHQNHRELLGEIQQILARVSGDVDRLHRLIPEEASPEARDVAGGLVRAIDEIILITRADWQN